jgi:hypothetical protein
MEIQIMADFTGILQPKLSNRFRVVFSDSRLSPVSLQVNSIYPPEKNYCNGPENGELYFEYDDDVLSGAASAINEVGNAGDKFDLSIQILDGNDYILEEMKFKDCRITSTSHVNALDYRGSRNHNLTQVAFDPKSIIGNLPESIPGGPEMIALLYKFFYNLSIDVTSFKDGPSGKVERAARISFETRTDSYVIR